MSAKLTFVVKFGAIALSIFITEIASAKCATWGCGTASFYRDPVRIGHFKGYTQDIKTDGYCVYIRARFTWEKWPAESWANITTSCGARKNYDTSVTSPNGANPLGGIRLYRGDGRYLTLWGH
jgi:hypothetical protein